MDGVALYGTNTSPPCRAVLLAAKCMGYNIEMKQVDVFGKKENMTETFLKMNPAHSVPLLDDKGFIIWESRAILAYLVQMYGKNDQLYPKDIKERIQVDNILHFDGASFFSSIGQYFGPQIFYSLPPDVSKEAGMKDKLSILNNILQDRVYVAGNKMTIADFSVIAGVSVFDSCNYDISSYTNVVKWAKKMKELPYYDGVMKEGVEGLGNFYKLSQKK